MFSIVIPTYNSSSYISKAFDSIAAQTVCSKLIEVIVVDDKSDDIDDLCKVIAEYNNMFHIRLIKNDIKGNASISRNIGIKNSKFDVVCLLDADDFWSENKLESGNKILNDNQDKIVVYTKLNRGTYQQLNDGNYQVIPKIEKRVHESLGEYWFERNGVTQTSSLMYNKNQFPDVFFNEKLKRHQDYDFCLKLESDGARFVLDNDSITNWVILDSTDNVVKKGANFEFCQEWLGDYLKYLNYNSQNHYIGKNIFLISLKGGELFKWIRYVASFNKTRSLEILMIAINVICSKIVSKVQRQ